MRAVFSTDHCKWFSGRVRFLAGNMHAASRLLAFFMPQRTAKAGVNAKMTRRRLLCVDDDSAFRQFYKNLLGSYGYEVTVAASAKQALKVFLSRKVDAVLTDFEMPGMTGAELAARLKKMRPELPVLLISGSAAVHQKPPSGVDATVAKGTASSKLVDQIEQALAKYQTRPTKLNPRRFAPLGSVLASIALAVYALPRLLR
jgi:CheY-like chemotaxis protein